MSSSYPCGPRASVEMTIVRGAQQWPEVRWKQVKSSRGEAL